MEEYRKELIKEISIIYFKYLLERGEVNNLTLNAAAENATNFANIIINEIEMKKSI